MLEKVDHATVEVLGLDDVMIEEDWPFVIEGDVVVLCVSFADINAVGEE